MRGRHQYDTDNLNDIVGKRFTRLVVTKYLYHKQDDAGHFHYYYEAQCDCGNIINVRREQLLKGTAKSCGCLKSEKIKSALLKDITNQRFGRLVAIEYDHTTASGKSYWKCQCDCGNTTLAYLNDLLSGKTRSCSCLSRERARKQLIEQSLTHGLSKNRLYGKYMAIIEWCYNPKNRSYPNYGGRGITVCKEWYDPDKTTDDKKATGNPEFINFVNWSYANGYFDYDDSLPMKDRPTLVRIDSNGPYAPWNCRYVTVRDQRNNVRTNRYIYDYDGMRYTVTDIAAKYNVETHYIFSKLGKAWSRNAIVYALHNRDSGIHIHNNTYMDKDGFIILMKRIVKQNTELDEIEGRNTLGT